MKIGLPRLRLSRKLLIITLGMTVLLGGTSVAALYFSKDMGLEGADNAIGGECTDVQTMVLKTPSNRLWLRRFIRMENASGPERVRTALRVAGLLAKKNAVDLIHVSVLDAHGPTLRSQMRARSIGAEVLIALKPADLPEMKSPAMASYYEGPVSDEGRYYGDKVVIDIDEIGKMMAEMRSIAEKPDCVVPEGAEDASAEPSGHDKKEEKADHGKKQEHEAKPAEDHGEQPAEAEGENSAEGHGDQPEKEGGEDHASAEPPAKEQSFLDSMLSMVGLGGGDAPATTEPAKDMSHAVAEEPADPASEDHGAKPASEEHEPAAKDESHAEKPAAEDHGETPAGGDEAKAAEHGDEPSKAHSEQTAEPASSEETAHDGPAPAEDHGSQPAAEAESHEEKPAAKAEDHSAAAGDEHQATDGEVKTVNPHEAGDKAETHADPASVMEEMPTVDLDDHAEPVDPKADEHAEAVLPVGD